MNELKVARLIQGTLFREGAGVKLHRYIGVGRDDEFEPILLFDYFDSSEELDYMAGFPPHPHRGFETITYLLHGTITHEDNKGHKGVINAGDVQWMTAGKGIVHSEMPSSSTGRLQGLQLWLNLPATEKMTEPQYQEQTSDQFPVETDASGLQVKVIAGSTDKGTRSPIKAGVTKPLFLDIQLPEGTTFIQNVTKKSQVVLFVLSGVVIVEDAHITKGVLAAFTEGETLVIKGLETSQCLLIAATKLKEPIVRHGPFVMNTPEEIIQAIDDFRNGKF
ncbi:MAG: pirin family protein [Gammaproteobacteria bacterium]|nr:pirin family protein [Gammaproteobacteria bacterium]